jgi:hypothetical protein
MSSLTRWIHRIVLAATALGLTAPGWAVKAKFEEARIFIEYNSSGNDLGFHVFLDGEDWRSLQISNPRGITIFEVQGEGAYRDLGMTELFFEGAEPSLDDVPLEDLLSRFPQGRYRFLGTTVDGTRIAKRATLSHAIPDGPVVSTIMNGDTVTIRWEPVTGPPAGFPARPITIVGYQVLVGSFQVTLPPSSTEVELPRQFVQSLEPGPQDFEVLAIEASGNQTITEGVFDAP